MSDFDIQKNDENRFASVFNLRPPLIEESPEMEPIWLQKFINSLIREGKRRYGEKFRNDLIEK